MKKQITTMLVFLISGSTFFITAAKAQVKLGIQLQGGISQSKNPQSADDVKTSYKPIAAYGAGIVATLPITEKFDVSASLNYLRKGLKMSVTATEANLTITSEGTAALNYLELPIQVGYNLQSANKVFNFSIGPSVGYGFSGKGKVKTIVMNGNVKVMEESEERKAFEKLADDNEYLKRFELSGLVSAGVTFESGLFLKLNYLQGISNIQKGEGTFRNRSGFLSIGYTFGNRN